MTIEHKCIKCGYHHHLSDDLAGKRIKCKNCSEVNSVLPLNAYLDYDQVSNDNSYPKFANADLSVYDDPPDLGMRILMPVGRSGFAIAAGYLGMFAVTVVFAPLAILFGLLAIHDIKKHPRKHGLGRAYFGIIMGILSIIGFILIQLLKQ